MKGVTSEVIAEVRGRANIVEVVTEFVVLKRAGKEYRGLCPFHSEKSPSFHVNPDKGIYKCFGCGEGGDVFAFLQKIKNLDFIDSVRDLAHKYGVQLVESQQERQEYDRRTTILMLYQHAAEFYSRMLKDAEQGAVARDYLQKRGITDDIVERFKLGYAPPGWDSLLRYLTSATKAAPATLEEAGLMRRKPESSSYYDLFRNRLMVPICDEQGRVIAFGGRTLGDDQVKYINSPETPIYTKGQHLFGLHLAKESIRAKDAVIVVEGYFDAITPHQYGFTNTVATLGTALTEQQARSLVRFTESKRVYLAFDSDAAGMKAVERGGETLNQTAEGVGIELRVIRIPGGKDPDECLRMPAAPDQPSGAELFADALQNALPLVDFQLHQAIEAGNLSNHTGRIEAARKLIPILAQMKNAVARGEYIRQWSMKLGLREEELLADVGQFRRDNRLTPRAVPSWQARQNSRPERASVKVGFFEAEQRLLALYLTSREDQEQVSAVLADERLISPAHQRIKEAIEGVGSQFSTVEDLQYKLMDRLAPDKEASSALVEIILKVEDIRRQNAPIMNLLVDLRGRLLQERLTQSLQLMQTKMRATRDDSELTTLQSRIIQLRSLSLVSATTLDEIDELKYKIEQATGSNELN